MGRTLVGYEVQKVLGAVDWFASNDKDLPVGVIGVGDGGRVALYAAAADERIKAAIVSCAFGPREGLHDEPLDRNLWNELREFGDAEVAALIHPRKFGIDPPPNSDIQAKPGYWPTWDGPAAPKPGRGGGAAPGALKIAKAADVDVEWKRFLSYCKDVRPLNKDAGEYGWFQLVADLSEGKGLLQ